MVGTLFAPVCLIGVIHIVMGVIVLLSPRAANVSGLAGFYGTPPVVTAIVFIGAGGLAIWAKLKSLPHRPHFVYLVPQQSVLLLQAWGVIMAMAAGQYPDGYIPANTHIDSALFILSDQAPILLLCASHLIEMIIMPNFIDNHWYKQWQAEYAARMNALRLVAMAENTKFWTDTVWEPTPRNNSPADDHNKE
jgi:hypothetical protein